ncbi:MAG: DUF1549 domain-containing protein [Planctomycetaceae bacterium]
MRSSVIPARINLLTQRPDDRHCFFLPVVVMGLNVRQLLRVCVVAIFSGTWQLATADAATPDFDREIAPLLASHCLECHSGGEAKGGLDLQRRERAMAGGDSGRVIEPSNVDASVLWQRVAADEMPPKHPLSAAEKELLRRWLEAGASWGTDPIDPFRYTTATRAGSDWWSLQPLQAVQPLPTALHDFVKNPIDRFVAARLEHAGLSPSPAADRRTLIRRLSIDLTGLPPSPDEVDAFVSDADPQAYERLVERLLASPHYGECWARHWLDVVRYGETDGFERNARRQSSWHYRDWLIAALNDDLPYDEFCRRQLCGDTRDGARPEDVIATGFLVAGVHNTVLGNDQMRAVARQDELEDLIGNVAQTYLGLTANCARCHDHKFDPIAQVDYYRLQATLSGVQHGEQTILVPELQAAVQELNARIETFRGERQALLAAGWAALLAEKSQASPTTSAPLSPIAAWDFTQGLFDTVGEVDFAIVGDAKLGPDGAHVHDGGYLKSAPLGRTLKTKTLEAWVRLDRLDQQGGGVLTVQSKSGDRFDSLVYAEREPHKWMAGSESFLRTQPLGGAEENAADAQFVHVAVVYGGDRTLTFYRNGEPYGTAYRPPGAATFDADAVLLVGCRHEPNVGNRPLTGTVQRARLYDAALTPEQIRTSSLTGGIIASEADLLAQLSPGERQRADELAAQISPLEEQLQKLQAHARFPAYAVKPQQPGETHLLRRGDLALPGELLTAGAIQSLAPLAAIFTDDAAWPEARRRQQLADWMTVTARPLLARVIVNRLWHYHFGIGLVETPSDFGFNGGRPSHPELLDWLAGELIRHEFRLKDVQRVIVMSATYRQSSQPRAECLAADAETRLLWRKRPLRLEAEPVRDSLLAAAGLLNDQLGGASFSDYRIIDAMNGTVYYEPDDPVGAEFQRRSIYRFLPRGANQGMLDVFDCPDPAASAPRRNATTTPLQALSLWNGSFALRMAEQVAANASLPRAGRPQDQIRRVYNAVLQRDPTTEEQSQAEALVSKYGLRSLSRALINSNEFLTLP